VAEKAEEMKLRDAIQQLAVEMPAYGYRRITAALQHAGWEANHKRVLRLMRADNLLCLRKRAFVRTTDSNHELRIYPNLARELKPSGLNQLWVADITYIRLLLEFVYLAVILDAFSRRVIGWALGRTLEAKLALEALRMALGRGRVVPGLVHHSDRGVQYASKDYVALLTEHGILISMSRPGNPYDKAYVSYCTLCRFCNDESWLLGFSTSDTFDERLVIQRFVKTATVIVVALLL
jgi:transposase InsO family protein